jgi:hypothetical protein
MPPSPTVPVIPSGTYTTRAPGRKRRKAARLQVSWGWVLGTALGFLPVQDFDQIPRGLGERLAFGEQLFDFLLGELP